MRTKKDHLARKVLIEAKTAKLVQFSTVKVMLQQAVGELLQKLNALERLLLPAVPIPDGPDHIDDICMFDQAITLEVAKMLIRAGQHHRKEMQMRYEQFIGNALPDEPVAKRTSADDIMITPPTIDELIEAMEKGSEDDADDDTDEGKGGVH